MTVCTLTSPDTVRALLERLKPKATYLLYAPEDCYIWYCARVLVYRKGWVKWLHSEDEAPTEPVSNDEFVEVVKND